MDVLPLGLDVIFEVITMHMHLPEQETKDVLQTTSSFLKWIYIAVCTGIFGGIVGICFHKSLGTPGMEVMQ